MRPTGEEPPDGLGKELSADWHDLSVDEVERKLGVTLTQGLGEAEARSRRQRYGPNEVASAPVGPVSGYSSSN